MNIQAQDIFKRDYQDQRISAQMEELMEARQTHTARAGERGRLRPVEGLDRYAGVMVPILAAGDVTGAVCLMLPESGAVPGEGEVKLTQIAAGFLGKQMEE